MISEIIQSWLQSDLEVAQEAILDKYEQLENEECENTIEMTFHDGRLAGLEDAINEIDKLKQND